MCQHLNEQDGMHEYLIDRITELETQVEELELTLIYVMNPGIDIEEVSRLRARKDVGIDG